MPQFLSLDQFIAAPTRFVRVRDPDNPWRILGRGFRVGDLLIVERSNGSHAEVVVERITGRRDGELLATFAALRAARGRGIADHGDEGAGDEGVWDETPDTACDWAAD